MGILSNLTNEDQANPARYGILKSQKNEVLRVLQVLGFNKQDFEWEYRSSNVMQNLETEVLVHKESNYYFHFDFRPDTQQWWAFYSPGKDVPVGKQQSNSWQAQLEVFAWW
ncbi:MAG: hypothetical protein KGJ14_09655, partial [Nitrospirota bacterium]|nr:hypothetical protein [Nitrospirota bacterium]